MKTSSRARKQRRKTSRAWVMGLSSRSNTQKSPCRRICLGRRSVLVRVTSQAQRQLRKAPALWEMTQQDRTLLERMCRKTTTAKAAPTIARAPRFAVTSAVAHFCRHRALLVPALARTRSLSAGRR